MATAAQRIVDDVARRRRQRWAHCAADDGAARLRQRALGRRVRAMMRRRCCRRRRGDGPCELQSRRSNARVALEARRRRAAQRQHPWMRARASADCALAKAVVRRTVLANNFVGIAVEFDAVVVVVFVVVVVVVAIAAAVAAGLAANQCWERRRHRSAFCDDED